MSRSVAISSSALFFILLLIILASSVLAQDASAPATRKQTAQEKLITKRENIAEKMASKAAALKTRLQNFKDQKKAVVAERINTNLNKVNQNQTAQMQKHLEKMTAILDKLEQRVNTGTPDIKDPVKGAAAIKTARNNIASAAAAVSAQAQKDYTITVTSEGRIGLDAKAERDALHKDLQATKMLVQDAKRSVADAIRIARSGPSTIKEGTPSGQ